MKRTVLIVLLTLVSSFYIQAQETGTSSLVKTNVNLFLSPYIGIEHKLGKKGAVNGEIGLEMSFIQSDQWQSRANPTIYLGYRYYYNILRRTQRGKNTQGNSANFILTNVGYQFRNITKYNGMISDPYTLSCSLQWGMRRAINHFYFETSLGAVNYWYNYQGAIPTKSECTAKINLLIGFLLPY